MVTEDPGPRRDEPHYGALDQPGSSPDAPTDEVAPDPLGPPPAALFDDPLPPPDELFDDRSTPPLQGPPPPSYASMPAPDAQSVPSESRNLASLAHLSALAVFVGIPSFVGPLVIWLLQKDRNAFVAEAAREALNFNLSLLIYGIAATLLVIVTVGLGLIVVVPLALAVVVAWLVLTVLAGVRASNGRMYHYPLTIRLVN